MNIVQVPCQKFAGIQQTQQRCGLWGRRKQILKVVGVGWDPENILGPPAGGHIARREQQKKYGVVDAPGQNLSGTLEGATVGGPPRKVLRVIPEKDEELIEYFLTTEAQDLEYEVARCRPKLNKEFFMELDRVIGRSRLLEAGKEDRVAELEMLRKYLHEAVEALENVTKELTTTTLDKLKKLLTSEDKKGTILAMAEKNEIDQPLIDLLDQNIESARSSKNEQAAEFMQKLRAACVKYLITPEKEEDKGKEEKKQKSNLIL